MLNKEEVLKIVNDNPDSFTMIIKAYHKDLYKLVSETFQCKKFSEKLYRWMYADNTKLGLCEKCGNPTKFMSFIVGFTQYCSPKCVNSVSRANYSKLCKTRPKNPKYWETKNCLVCGKEFQSFIRREQKMCSGKCSAIYVARNPNRIEKRKQTKLEKYGDENYVNSEKAKETCLERYGVDNASKSPMIIDRIKETNQQRFGVDWTFQSEIVKDKIKETCLERYGTEVASKSDIVKNRAKETSLKKCGYDNISKCPEIIEKIKKIFIEKYGYTCPLRNANIQRLVREKSRRTHYYKFTTSSKVLDVVIPLFTIDEYVDTNRINKYKFQCKKCNDVFEDHIDGGHVPRCLKCNPFIAGFSLYEKEVVDYIKSITTDNVIEKSRSILNGSFELDIYIPAQNTAIEFDGLYWHSEGGGKKDKNYHLNKTIECDNKGIKLIHLFEDEWVNNKEVVKSRLLNILHKDNTGRIYARKCDIKEIDYNAAKDFLDAYHLQKNVVSKIRLGLYRDNNLVSVMTFGKSRLALGGKSSDNEWEMLRYASSKNVVGGASKLLSYFIEKNNPIKIITFADRRWSNRNNMYEKIGFKFLSETPPNYFYFKKGYADRFHRFNFRKDILNKKLSVFDPNLSEWENMQLNGYDRIWDCGSYKYEWNVK